MLKIVLRLALGACLCLVSLAAQPPLITTIAGIAAEQTLPQRGFSGDGDSALMAGLALANLQNQCDPSRFEQTSHISIDASGNLYIADSENQRIRKITAQRIISTIAGSGERPSTNSRCEATTSIGDGAQSRDARLFNPTDVLALPNGSLIIADQQNNRIRQVSPSGVITTIAGSGQHNLYAPGVPATASPMDWPSALAVDSGGLLYFAELHGNRIARINPDGRLATIAGTGFPGSAGDGQLATSAQLRKPAGMTFDTSGNLLIADTGNHKIRKVGLNGVITTVAGTGVAGFSGDGQSAVNAQLDTPMDVKVDRQGNIYIADTTNHRVRRVDPAGVITTVAGTGQPGRGPDLVPASTSSLNLPCALAVDVNDDVYIVDWQNYLIRKIIFGGKPVVASGGVVNGATFVSPAAPGGIAAIFGANLASAAAVANSASWPRELAGVTAEVNGVTMPLYSVSPQQLTGQLPVDLVPGPAYMVIRTAAGASEPVPFNVTPAAPGIFLYPGTTRAIATNQDGFTLNSADAPAPRGEVIVAYLTGLGAVTPAVVAGIPAPLDALSGAALPYSATLGSVPAEVQFLGLTPGFIGLAQANIKVPANAPTGSSVPLIITVGGQASNAATVSLR